MKHQKVYTVRMYSTKPTKDGYVQRLYNQVCAIFSTRKEAEKYKEVLKSWWEGTQWIPIVTCDILMKRGDIDWEKMPF